MKRLFLAALIGAPVAHAAEPLPSFRTDPAGITVSGLSSGAYMAGQMHVAFSDRIAGAGLDVFETEPLPDDSPLWGMQNVILTPHVSGMTAQYDERAVDLFVANLRRYLAGETLFNVVDRDAGY